eukprot:7713937-Alexandrium_andersonii.AAC.1
MSLVYLRGRPNLPTSTHGTERPRAILAQRRQRVPCWKQPRWQKSRATDRGLDSHIARGTSPL